MHNFPQKTKKKLTQAPGPQPPFRRRNASPWGGFFRKYLQRLENKKASARGSKLGHRKACARRFTSPWAVGARPGRFVCLIPMPPRNHFKTSILFTQKTAGQHPFCAESLQNPSHDDQLPLHLSRYPRLRKPAQSISQNKAIGVVGPGRRKPAPNQFYKSKPSQPVRTPRPNHPVRACRKPVLGGGFVLFNFDVSL
jgi:hypothetical protein